MYEQIPVEINEPVQEIVAMPELGDNDANFPGELGRKESLFGPGSAGEKALFSKDPVWLISPKARTPIFISCLSSLDEVVATPFFNVGILENACNQDFKLFDAINKSKYAGYADGTLAGLGLFAISLGVYVVKYCQLREIEKNSNYFYFVRLFKMYNEEIIKNAMGAIAQDGFGSTRLINYEHLLAAAYFYPPDISKFACWRRRFFSSGKKRKQLKALNKLFEKKPKKETIDKLHEQVNEKLSRLLNNYTRIEKFEKKLYKNNWTIGLSKKYEDKFLSSDRVTSYLSESLRVTLKENQDKKNKNFIPAILAALGQASFIYWILMFIFCFIPIAPVVSTAMISVTPLFIALCGALPVLLFIELKNAYKTYITKKNKTSNEIEVKGQHVLEKKVVNLDKQNMFVALLKAEGLSSTVELYRSPLMKGLHRVLENRRYSKCHAIFVGFLDGCFLPLFTAWLFLDATKAILTFALCPAGVALTSFTPIGLFAAAIVAGGVLLAGISYGIYSAYKANRVHEDKFNALQHKIYLLEKELPNKKVLNKSLQEYDRILRRYSDERPVWTNVKKGLSRLTVLIKRLGTGSLVFRLVIWAPITAVVAACGTVIPAFFPIILIVGIATGAFFAASWFLHAYNLESKTMQAGRVLEHLVQSEQLTWTDQSSGVVSSGHSLTVYDMISERIALISPYQCRGISENDEQFFSVGSVETNCSSAESAETLIGMQRVDSSSILHGGLFKGAQCVENQEHDEYIEACLNVAIPGY